jgi:hypothetical protein
MVHADMSRRAIVISLVCAALAAVAAFLIILRVTEGGPLTTITLGGKPDFSVDGGFFYPGQAADFGIWVIDTARDPVTLVSASLIPISGHPAGRLAFLAVSLQRGSLLVGGHGLPPIHDYPTRPFRGARLRHGYNTVVFGFAGNRIGGFDMVAGLRITYRYHGQLYTMSAWSASTACVIRNGRLGSWKGGSRNPCMRAENIDRRATERLAGV